MEEILVAFLSKTLNIDTKQVAELVKTAEGEPNKDALKQLLTLDKERVQRLTNANDEALKERFDNGYAKAKKEVLGDFEKEVREKFELQSDKKGFDLINELVDSRVNLLKKEGLTPDAIKKSSTYLEMVEAKNKEAETKVETLKTDYEGKLNQFKTAEVNKKITDAAFAIIDSLNPVLSEDSVKATNQKKSVIQQLLNTGKFELNDKGVIIPLNSEGKMMEDEHKNPIPFEKLVRDTTVSLFDLKAAEDRSSGGADDKSKGGDDKKQQFKWTGVAPKNSDEYSKMILSAESLDEKAAITKSWNEVKTSV